MSVDATSIICHGCGLVGAVNRVTANLRCTCGSHDLDLYTGSQQQRSFLASLQASRTTFAEHMTGEMPGTKHYPHQDKYPTEYPALPGWSEYVGPKPGLNDMDNGYPHQDGERTRSTSPEGADGVNNLYVYDKHAPRSAPTEDLDEPAVKRHQGPSTQTTVPFVGRRKKAVGEGRPKALRVDIPDGDSHDLVSHSHYSGGGVIVDQAKDDPEQDPKTRWYAEAEPTDEEPEVNLGFHPTRNHAAQAIAGHHGWDMDEIHTHNEKTNKLRKTVLRKSAGRPQVADPMGSPEEHIKSTTPGWGSDDGVGKADHRSPAFKHREERDYTKAPTESFKMEGADCPNCGQDPTHLKKDYKEDAWWHCPNCGPLANVDRNPEIDPYSPSKDFQPNPRSFKASSRGSVETTGQVLDLVQAVTTTNPGLTKREALLLARKAASRYSERTR